MALGDRRVALLRDIFNRDLNDFLNETPDKFARLSDLKDDEKINVKHFGAKGDGVADDTVAIQDAISEAKNSDVKNVFFPAGNYKISNTIYTPSWLSLFGMGRDLTRLFLADGASANLPIIEPVEYSSTNNNCRWKSMIVAETAHHTHTEHTEGIKISDMTIDWNDNDCHGYSINAVMMVRTNNCVIENVHIPNVLPKDLENTNTKYLGQTILFGLGEDNTLRYSKVGSGDYEGVSIWMLSKRTRVYGNVFIADKPETYSDQTHQIQIARPSLIVNELETLFGETRPSQNFIYSNTFLMKRNTRHVVTAHSADGVYINDNFVKFFSTLGTCSGFKPFDGTVNFSENGNIFDLTEYEYDPLASPLLMVGTYANLTNVANGIIANNQVFVNSNKTMPSYHPEMPMVGGVFSNHQNIQITNNNVYISGETQENRSIFGITGINIQITNNNVYLENQAETITEDDLVFASSKRGLQVKITGNQVFGKIAKGVKLDDDSGNYRNFEVKDNQWDALENITKDNKDDAEIIIDDVKKREGFTEIQLNNIVGHRYNFNNPLDSTTYTFKHAKIGGKAEVLINAETEPTLNGGTRRNGSVFIPNTDMIMHIEVRDLDRIRYYFEPYTEEVNVWVDDVAETTAKVYFVGIEPQSDYDVWLNGSYYATINESGDEISGLEIGTTYSLQIDTDEGLTDAITFKTVAAEFYSIWDTTKSGISGSDQIALPLKLDGAYDFKVRYNGEVIKSVNSYTDNVITFPDGGGVKEINIVGTINGFNFETPDQDQEKILEVVKFGENFYESERRMFRSCSNLSLISDDLDGGGFYTTMEMMRESGITSFPSIDFPNATTFESMFYKCSKLSAVHSFDVSNAESFSAMFYGTIVSEIGNFDFSNGEDFSNAFRTSVPITEFLPRRFDKLKNGVGMFLGTSIPTEAWSEILINLEAYNTNNDVQIHGGNSKYNSSAVSARNALIARGWTITDGGQE